MTQFVTLDPQGVVTPLLTLLNDAPYLNASGLDKLTELVEDNFSNMAKFRPKGRQEFVITVLKQPMSQIEMMQTPYLQQMQKSDCPYHKKMLKYVTRDTLTFCQENVKGIEVAKGLEEYIARVQECYLNKRQMESSRAMLKNISNWPAVKERRGKIGKAFYNAVVDRKELTLEGFNLFLNTLRKRVEDCGSADDAAGVLKELHGYLKFCVERITEENDLSVIGPCYVKKGALTWKDELLYRDMGIKTLEAIPTTSKVINFVLKYIKLFSMAEGEPLFLAKDVVNKLDYVKMKAWPDSAK